MVYRRERQTAGIAEVKERECIEPQSVARKGSSASRPGTLSPRPHGAEDCHHSGRQPTNGLPVLAMPECGGPVGLRTDWGACFRIAATNRVPGNPHAGFLFRCSWVCLPFFESWANVASASKGARVTTVLSLWLPSDALNLGKDTATRW